MAVASLLWLYILHRLPATISSLSSLIVPIVGVLAAWLQLGERPTAAEGLGMVLILAGLLLLALPQRSAQPYVCPRITPLSGDSRRACNARAHGRGST